MCLKIKNGAVFIADAHENDKRKSFYHFLQLIESKEIKTPQLFLMGDMFDLLVGKVEYSVKKYKKYIDLIDKISLHVEVFYFEGNHDFALENLFKNVQIIPIQSQPKKFFLEDETLVYLAHGDKYGGFVHNSYTKLIRSNTVLKFLNIIDSKKDNFIAKKIENDQFRKNICTKIENFEDIITAKLPFYKAEQNSFIVEGHYHQNHSFSQNGYNYINLPSFACNQSYFIVECFKREKFTQCKLRG
jgi:UDP-2,3-diacylglucosamine hydrolase